MSLRVHIQRLVIDRALATDRAAHAEAIREALAQQLAPQLAHAPTPAPRAVGNLDAGAAAAGPAALGGQVAAAVGRVVR